jgi:hypothetical protein
MREEVMGGYFWRGHHRRSTRGFIENGVYFVSAAKNTTAKS